MNEKAQECLNKEVLVAYHNKKLEGILHNFDTYLNLTLKSKNKTYFIRGDKVKDITLKKRV